VDHVDPVDHVDHVDFPRERRRPPTGVGGLLEELPTDYQSWRGR
jgi:hypothetical protein